MNPNRLFMAIFWSAIVIATSISLLSKQAFTFFQVLAIAGICWGVAGLYIASKRLTE